MSVFRGTPTPPTVQIQTAGGLFDLKLVAPRFMPVGEVSGFAAAEQDFLDQAQVDHAVAALQAFVAAAPAEDQVVYAALLAQAEGFGESNWPDD